MTVQGVESSGTATKDYARMLNQYNESAAQTEKENREMQKAQAFWNPLEALAWHGPVGRSVSEPPPSTVSSDYNIATAYLKSIYSYSNSKIVQNLKSIYTTGMTKSISVLPLWIPAHREAFGCP